jgi:hypothetical protein
LSLEEHGHPNVESPAGRRKWVGGWTIALFVAGATLFWCLLIYRLIGDRPPGWQYGVVPYIPAQSPLSSQPPPRGVVRNQVVLPLKQPGGANEKP